MSASLLRTSSGLARQLRASTRSFAASARQWDAATVPSTTKAETAPATIEEEDPRRTMQAPNRADVWARSQKPRAKAMAGPRFEQTDFGLQPTPYSAMELVHKQPVRWTHDRVVACDGGGGPAGHPRIFINVDKPEICVCNYCGLPYANEHHREHLEKLPQTSYPLA